MNEITVGSLGSILPEIILLVGGLLILILDTAMSDENDSGRGYMAISVVFLIAGLIGVILQLWSFLPPSTREPFTALAVIDIDPFGGFMKVSIYMAMLLGRHFWWQLHEPRGQWTWRILDALYVCHHRHEPGGERQQSDAALPVD